MAPKKKRLKIVKVPLEYKPEDIPINFPPFTQLYLELLENKKKVKSELRNKEYTPKVINTVDSNTVKKSGGTIKPQTTINLESDLNFEDKDSDDKPKKEEGKNKEEKREYEKSNEQTMKEEEKNKENKREYEKSKEKKNKILDFTNFDSKSHRDSFSREMKYKDNIERERENRENKRESYRRKTRSIRSSSHHRSRRHRRTKDRSDENERQEDDRRDKKEKSENSKRLDELLNEKTDDIIKEKSSSEKESSKYDSREIPKDKIDDKKETTSATGSSVLNGIPKIPPSLFDIEKGEVNTSNFRGVNVSNINVTQVDEVESNKKKELLFRFDILRRSYKGAIIPEYSEHTDITTMQRSYDDTVRRLSLDATVDSYKKYLIYGFGITEFILGTWFKFDMNGFTQQQILTMNSYEKLLIELGEKSYLTQQSNWSIEVRLLATIVFNAVIFIGSKMIFSKTGTNFMNMINSQAESAAANKQQPKKKMRGPDIDISGL